MKKTEIIELKTGKIQGYIEDNLSIFKGIPYAEPPVGELRLNIPQPKKPWDGVLDTSYYRPIVPQPPPIGEVLNLRIHILILFLMLWIKTTIYLILNQ